MTSKPISLVDPAQMSPKDRLKWIQEWAKESSEKCTLAREYYEDMAAYHSSIAELAKEQLKVNADDTLTSEEKEERSQSIANAVYQTVLAMQALNGISDKEDDEDMSIEDWETSLLSGKEKKSYSQARNELDNDLKEFRKRYNELKASLGLETQKDVAEMTGLDHRQISRIEQGKTRPQFKTLQKLADGFGVKVTDLMP